jgi:ribonuclease HII
MPWIIGIDEAGYGPNLGPFVMTSVACRVPDAHGKADLWKLLDRAVRRHSDPCDERMVVADSKQVYSTARGLAELEHCVLAALQGSRLATLAAMVDRVSALCHDAVRQEVWYVGTTALPVAADIDACHQVSLLLGEIGSSLQINLGTINSVIVCATEFNALIHARGTKGGVLAVALQKLLQRLPTDGDPVYVFCDKHGGRNFYGDALQCAFPEDMVLSRLESALCSHYYVESGGRHVELTFEPRADANHFCVALASMVSKYLRELFMLEFNQFWQTHVPGLKATAGYPTDSKRFWTDIQKAAQKLGLDRDVIWRRK